MKKYKVYKQSNKVTTVRKGKVPETIDEKKERQRQWAINRKFEIRDYLFVLGKQFDNMNVISK